MLLEHYYIFVHDAIVKLQTKKTGKLGCTQLALLVSILSTLSVFTFFMHILKESMWEKRICSKMELHFEKILQFDLACYLSMISCRCYLAVL